MCKQTKEKPSSVSRLLCKSVETVLLTGRTIPLNMTKNVIFVLLIVKCTQTKIMIMVCYIPVFMIIIAIITQIKYIATQSIKFMAIGVITFLMLLLYLFLCHRYTSFGGDANFLGAFDCGFCVIPIGRKEERIYMYYV